MFKIREVGSDPEISLKDLKAQVDEWIESYGEEAVLTTDAGYNNVNIIIDNRNKTMNSYKRSGL